MLNWLSSFMLNPAMALGTTAVAGPILIHIFARRRFRKLRWAAMSFLLEAHRQNRRRVRLEQLILLLLRSLAVILLALVMTRPFLRPSVLSRILGAAPRTDRIILLDDSYSMAYEKRGTDRPVGQSAFANAKLASTQVARWASELAPADTLSLFLTSDAGRPVLSLVDLSDESLAQLEGRLATVEPSETPARIPDAILKIADLVERAPTQVNTAVYIITDLRRHDWTVPIDPSTNRPRSVAAPFAELADRGKSIKLILVDALGGSASTTEINAAIVALSADQPQIVAGVPARFEVEIANYSPQSFNDLLLGVSVARHRLPPIEIPDLGPNQRIREPIEITFPLEGSDFLRLELDGAAMNQDGIRLDDARALAVAVLPALQILLIDGEANSDPYRDEVFLLQTALRPPGRAASGNDLTIADEQALGDMNLADYHVLILANVGRLSKQAKLNVEQFVSSGGGLIVFAGDQLEAEYYNEELFDGDGGVLPAQLIEARSSGTTPIHFLDWDENHPIMRAFTGKFGDLLRNVQVFDFVAVSLGDEPSKSSLLEDTQDETEEILPDSLGDGTRPKKPDVEPTNAPTVVARFSDVDHSPAILQGSFGRGKTIFVATSADQEWNDWASSFTFLPFVLELTQFAARAPDAAGQSVVLGPVVCPLDASIFKPRARLRSPDYPLTADVALDAKPIDRWASALVHDHTPSAGIYEFLLTTNSDREIVRYAAVNPDPQESDIQRIGRDEITEERIGLAFEFVEDIEELKKNVAAAKQELWWPLLMIAVIVLMTEQSLAWWFGTRG